MPPAAEIVSPLDLVQLPFLREALAELLLLAVAGGLLGAWVVLRRLAFFSHAVGTATFPGLVAAEAAGVGATGAGLVVALGYAGAVGRARRSGRDPGDSATALGLVAALALGIVLASDVFESGSAVDRLLFGSLLALDAGDLALSATAAVLAVGAALSLGRVWTASGFDPAAGLPRGARVADAALLAVLAFAVVAAIPAVGALLVTSLFVVPAAIARLVARSVGQLALLAVGLALLQGLIGLYLAWALDSPPGPTVAVAGACTYAAAVLVRGART